MRVLLSTIGSRGEVQPVVALGVRLVELGHEARVCAPPDFRSLVEGLGLPFVPIGPELKGTAEPGRARPTPSQLKEMADASVVTQFETVGAAVEGCDALVAGGALQFAARSVAEAAGVPYSYTSYCPVTLPSDEHAPPPLSWRGGDAVEGDNRVLWERDADRWNTTFGEVVNARRTALGLPAVDDVRGHIFGERPLLAADPVLGPWDGASGVVQTGAWLLPDSRPLSADLEAFLEAGEPPVYFGFGSVRAPVEMSRVMVSAARAAGRRAVVLRGWTGLDLVDEGGDCLSLGEVNQRALFPRVAAVVHHGGAGTTTAAALSGAPQVVVPQMYDQFYWGERVASLGIGVAHREPPTAESLATALGEALRRGARAREVAGSVRTDGADVAARLVTG
ncbi:glycosyltransferase [Umezawaea sp. NPDC059074]|uniref:glycosyltransferase n=1 Tax=Umezawaea sp. NPDC059074 TaxID=3346716 RepID=UPI00369C7E6D